MKDRRGLAETGIMAAVLMVLGLWHLLDVRAGAAAYGDAWLTGWYLVLWALVMGASLALGWLFLRRVRGRQWELTRIYPIAGLAMGLAYLLVFPPLSAPDEISHYLSAYELSSRLLGQPVRADNGQVLVRAQDWFLEDPQGSYPIDSSGAYWQAGELPEGTEAYILGQPLMEGTYRQIHDVLTGKETAQQQALRGAWQGDEVLAASRYNTVNTTPAAYIPQAVGISLARLLHLNSLWLAYLGRIMNLLFFVGMTWLALRRLPFGKEVLFGVALLPMTLHLAASFSYDVMILACMFLFTAVCLDLAYARERVRIRDVALLAALMAAGGPCKMVYAPMMGLCLLIPVRKFGGWGKWLASAIAVVGAWVVVMVLVNADVVSAYASAVDAVLPVGGEAGFSLTLLMHRPLLLLQMFYNTFLHQLDEYHLTMIGSQLSSLDAVLNVPYFLVVFYTAGLLLLAFRVPGESLILTGGRRWWAVFVCAVCMAAAMLSMLISWTPRTSAVIEGVQGRYFLPFLPVLLMACKNDRLVLTKDGNRSILYLMCCANLYVVLRLFSVVCMRG